MDTECSIGITKKDWDETKSYVKATHDCIVGTYEKTGLIQKMRNQTKANAFFYSITLALVIKIVSGLFV